MTPSSSGARLAAALAIAVLGGLAGFAIGVWLTDLMGRPAHGEARMAQALTALFIAGPAGALTGSLGAGLLSHRWWRTPSAVAATLAWLLAVAAVFVAAREIGFI
jgi:hypothetical protein